MVRMRYDARHYLMRVKYLDNSLLIRHEKSLGSVWFVYVDSLKDSIEFIWVNLVSP